MKAQLYKNCKIFTSNQQIPYAEMMLVEDGVIKWVGANNDLPGGDYDQVDLLGRTIIPGFVDAHQHPITLADYNKRIAILPPNIYSIEDMKKTIKVVSGTKRQDEWIVGWGFDEGKLKEKRSPNRYDLDEASPVNPTYITRSCGHIIVANSKALSLAGITAETPNPTGGQIDRDENGEPTGILRENARFLIQNISPQTNKTQLIEDIVDLGKTYLSQGITAVCDMGSLDGYIDTYEYYLSAADKGFKQKVGVYYFWDQVCNQDNFNIPKEHFDKKGQVHVQGIKMLGDGSISGQTAWVDAPYENSNNYGMCTYEDEMFDDALNFCKENKCQFSVHAMGGRTIRKVVDRMAGEKKWNSGAEPAFRIEHLTELTEEEITKIKQYGIGISTQPIFYYSEIESYHANLGEERTKKTYPLKTLLESNVRMSLSTDAPATSWAVPSDPFINIKAAVTKRAYDGTDCGLDEKIDIETAIRLYTIHGAEIGGFEKIGCIKEGYSADFLVLDKDILTVPEDKIDEVNVEKTYISGQCVFSKDEM